MARKVDPGERATATPGAERDRLDAPDASVDPRFWFTVSVPPLTYVSSKGAGWDGALLAEGDAGFVRSGEVRHEHQGLVIQRWYTPLVARPIGSAGGWTTSSPGTRIYLPGEREYGEWCGRPRSQMLFLAPERVEAVLGVPWDSSGLTRWRDPRHQLPFVDDVISAMMWDLEAGHPAGAITGDALVVALLLHLDSRKPPTRSPGPGALGSRLGTVRDYVEAHLAQPLRLAELAVLAGVGVRRFGALFAAETGCSPGRYVLRRRIERARELLRDPDRTLAQVARAVGFANTDQLSRVFREHTGAAPDAQRRPGAARRGPPRG